MSDHEEARGHALVLAMRAAALALASAAADLAVCDSLDGDDLQLITELRVRLDETEVAMVALARRDDVTWQQVSRALSVTRQSVHRRLNRAVEAAAQSAQDMATDASRMRNAEAAMTNAANDTLQSLWALGDKVADQRKLVELGRRGDRPEAARPAAPEAPP